MKRFEYEIELSESQTLRYYILADNEAVARMELNRVRALRKIFDPDARKAPCIVRVDQITPDESRTIFTMDKDDMIPMDPINDGDLLHSFYGEAQDGSGELRVFVQARTRENAERVIDELIRNGLYWDPSKKVGDRAVLVEFHPKDGGEVTTLYRESDLYGSSTGSPPDYDTYCRDRLASMPTMGDPKEHLQAMVETLTLLGPFRLKELMSELVHEGVLPSGHDCVQAWKWFSEPFTRHLEDELRYIASSTGINEFTRAKAFGWLYRWVDEHAELR